jgi:hypothetical protein
MTKKQFHLLIFLNLYFALGYTQTHNPEFQKTVDSINSIIKVNKLAYYSPNQQYSEHIIRISATQLSQKLIR